MSNEKVPVQLDDVPETALWTLYHRAAEASRPDTLLPDPMAVELVERIDYPFAERFGPGDGAQGQFQALRSGCFDREVEDFLARCPRGQVVALGEGLETQFWRVDNGRVRWLTVDLPESVAVRERLLPTGPRQRLFACSATDPRWMDEVDPAQGVLITAQGLLMYLRPGEVRDLLAACAEHFPGGSLVFDTVPRWLARKAAAGKLHSRGYQVPAMHFGMNGAEQPKLATAHPGIAEVRDVAPVGGRGLVKAILPYFARLPRRPSVVAVRFAAPRLV
ncbi:class I SAM-dependent methyltransferase [Kitasatospora sp. McL0602]|uniref:class I SAM-dependent methyltransferase n=1 Tax=Kitasatospora sp. McL0602 TaxID=3439530 RepID=UPI003F89AEAC